MDAGLDNERFTGLLSESDESRRQRVEILGIRDNLAARDRDELTRRVSLCDVLLQSAECRFIQGLFLFRIHCLLPLDMVGKSLRYAITHICCPHVEFLRLA